MLGSLTSGVSGLESFQQEMDVIGNNIANVNTTGFKAGVVNFADTFSNTLRAPGSGTAATSGANSIQVGTGVAISGIDENWTNGAINSTGVATDFAISGTGAGFFMVKDTSNGASYATRAGAFTEDANGYIITDGGDRLQGYTDSGLTTLGDIKIDLTGYTGAASMTGWSVDGQGKVNISLSDGTTFTRGQILLQNFQDPQKLLSAGNNLYTNLAGAGPLAAPTAPGSNGLGSIQQNALEQSNVDLSNEMVNLITAQRAFEANSKIITTSDEALQTVVNMKR